VDGRIDIAVDDLLIEASDEGTGLTEAVNQFIAQFVTGRRYLHEFHLAFTVPQAVGYRLGLP
jgi:hypothetical protein